MGSVISLVDRFVGRIGFFFCRVNNFEMIFKMIVLVFFFFVVDIFKEILREV